MPINNQYGTTSLHDQLINHVKQGDLQAVANLLGQYPKEYDLSVFINKQPNEFDFSEFIDKQPNLDGYTALHWAVNNNNRDIVQLLLGAGANPNIRNNFGYTALHFATANLNKDMIQMLLDAGSRVNVVDIFGDTALHKAVKKDDISIVKMLLGDEASIDVQREFYSTLLSLALWNRNIEMVELLRQHTKDDIYDDLYNHGRYTALVAAAERGNMDVVKFLLAVEENPNIKIWEHNAALAIAQNNKKDSVAKELKSFLNDPILWLYHHRIQGNNNPPISSNKIGDIQSFLPFSTIALKSCLLLMVLY